MNLDAVADRFRRNFAERDELGASLSIWSGGKEVLSLHEGWADRERSIPWTDRTIVPVWSATKGPAALTALLALHGAGCSLRDPVAKVWPELLAARDERLTFAQLLSHQGGLSALDPERRPNLLSYAEVVAALERQPPWWEPGKGHGYHPRTYGYLLDEVVRRVAGGIPLARYWNERIARPLGIDFKIGGLGAEDLPRLATIVPPSRLRAPLEERAFFESLAKSESLPAMAFASPAGMGSLAHINQLDYLQAGLPALGGAGSARGLAKFYQILADGGRLNGVTAFPPEVVKSAGSLEVAGLDRTFLIPTAFTPGFMTSSTSSAAPSASDPGRGIFGGLPRAFGHPGAGGSHAFADPESGLSFAYVMNRMESGILPNRKSLDLLEALGD